MMGLLATGTSCFAAVCVSGRRRVPLPPLSTNPFNSTVYFFVLALTAFNEELVNFPRNAYFQVCFRHFCHLHQRSDAELNVNYVISAHPAGPVQSELRS